VVGICNEYSQPCPRHARGGHLGVTEVTFVLRAHNRRVHAFAEGTPVILVRDGEVFWKQLRRCNVAPEDLDVAMRHSGCEGHPDIALAILETSGEISIQKRER